nr:heme-binding protein [Novosphingobium flavum]
MLSPPRPAGSRPATPNPVIPGPGFELAQAAIQAAVAKCSADGARVGVAVVNSLGVLVAGAQMDGLTPGHVYNAARKGLAAIEFGEVTSAVQVRLRGNDFATLARVRPNMSVFPGGVPLIVNGKVVGAVAASGSAPSEDEACAAAGAAAIAARL